MTAPSTATATSTSSSSSSSRCSSNADIAAAKAALAPNHPPSAWLLGSDNDGGDDTTSATTAAAAASIAHEPGSASVTINGHTFVDTTVRQAISNFRHGEDSLPLVPAIIAGCCRDWDAYASDTKRWSMTNLRERLCPDNKLSLDGGPCFARMSINTGRVTMAAYQDYCEQGGADKDIAPLYLFDADVLQPSSTFANGSLVCDDFCIPPCFAQDSMAGLTGSRFRPLPPAWLLVGVSRSGTPIHDHPFFVAWNALLVGCKLWCCFPPDVDESVLLLDTATARRPGHQEGDLAVEETLFDDEDDDFEFDSSALEWFAQCCSDGRRLPDCARILVQQPGEVAYVPPGWWHVVLNIETSTAICCSLTLARDIPRLFPPLFSSDEEFARSWLDSLEASPRVAQALHDLAVVYDSSISTDPTWDNPELAATCYARSAAMLVATNVTVDVVDA